MCLWLKHEKEYRFCSVCMLSISDSTFRELKQGKLMYCHTTFWNKCVLHFNTLVHAPAGMCGRRAAP